MKIRINLFNSFQRSPGLPCCSSILYLAPLLSERHRNSYSTLCCVFRVPSYLTKERPTQKASLDSCRLPRSSLLYGESYWRRVKGESGESDSSEAWIVLRVRVALSVIVGAKSGSVERTSSGGPMVLSEPWIEVALLWFRRYIVWSFWVWRETRWVWMDLEDQGTVWVYFSKRQPWENLPSTNSSAFWISPACIKYSQIW